MYKQFVFQKPPNIEKNKIIDKFRLAETLENDRTCICENEDVVFSIDKKVIRVFLYDASNKKLIDNIKEFFYGKKWYKG